MSFISCEPDKDKEQSKKDVASTLQKYLQHSLEVMNVAAPQQSFTLTTECRDAATFLLPISPPPFYQDHSLTFRRSAVRAM